jgi:hypothetical protein
MAGNTLKRIWIGEMPKQFWTHRYWPVMFSMYGVLMVIARLFFPGYNMLAMSISYMGNPYVNPIGCIPWSIAHAAFGVMMFPGIRYMYHQLALTPRKFLKSGTFFMVLAAYGIIGLGVIPQFHFSGSSAIHVFNAACLIGGFYIANLLWSGIMNKDPGVSKPLRSIWGLLTFGLFIGIGLSQAILLAVGGTSQACIGGTCPWYFSIDLGEWFILFVIMADFAILLFLIPERKN